MKTSKQNPCVSVDPTSTSEDPVSIDAPTYIVNFTSADGASSLTDFTSENLTVLRNLAPNTTYDVFAEALTPNGDVYRTSELANFTTGK